MQTFDIIKQSDINKTYRVAHIMSDYDVKAEHSSERFTGEIKTPDEWNIGCICGNSGTGKSTIAKTLFADAYIDKFEYTHKSVVDDMPDVPMVEIEKTFYSVGFGSVPSWLKPYSVLSTGEKMRVDLARAMLQYDFFVFDEFTSVVDRNVAQTTSIAIAKAIRRSNKKIIVVTCHEDIIEWLQPDWVFDTNNMQTVFQSAHAQTNNSSLENVGVNNGRNLDAIII